MAVCKDCGEKNCNDWRRCVWVQVRSGQNKEDPAKKLKEMIKDYHAKKDDPKYCEAYIAELKDEIHTEYIRDCFRRDYYDQDM